MTGRDRLLGLISGIWPEGRAIANTMVTIKRRWKLDLVTEQQDRALGWSIYDSPTDSWVAGDHHRLGRGMHPALLSPSPCSSSFLLVSFRVSMMGTG